MHTPTDTAQLSPPAPSAASPPPDLASPARSLLLAGLWVATGRTFPVADPGALVAAARDETYRATLLELALDHRLVPILDRYARHHALDLGTAPARLTEIFRLVAAEHYRRLTEIVTALSRRGIDIALLKGGDLALNVYPDDLPRSMADLDILARPPDVAAVEEVLHEAGFVQGLFDSELVEIRPVGSREKAEAEAGEPELLAYVQIVRMPALAAFAAEIRAHLHDTAAHRLVVLGNEVFVGVYFDVHRNLEAGFDLRDIWRDPRTITLPGGPSVLAQSWTDLLWFLATRAYHEVLVHTRPAMRYFVDVIALLHRYGDQIDWQRVVDMGVKYKLQPSLYFVFHHARELLGPVVPDRALAAFALPARAAARWHDWGDFVPKLLGEEAPLHPLLAGDGLGRSS
jgi:hypothetical protein